MERIPESTPMNKRITTVTPETTIRIIDRTAKPGQRPDALKAQLKHAAIRDRDLDREIATAWSAVDGETWQRLDGLERRKNSTASRPSTPE